MINPRFHHLCRKPSHSHHGTTTMLVALHALIDIMSYYTPSVHSDAYYISKLLLISCLAPVHLSLTSSQYISVEFSTKLIQGVDLHSVCKNP
jgi:hypothetical protein